MKYFIGIVPNTETAQVIDQLRILYCPKLAHHLEPHITVIPPFESFENLSWLIDMKQVTCLFSEFSLRLSEPFFFGKRVLSFSVLDDQAILTDLVGILRGTQQIKDRDTRPYHAHLTLAMQSFGTSYERMLEMRDKAKMLLMTLPPLHIEEVIVFARETSGWTRRTTLSLCK